MATVRAWLDVLDGRFEAAVEDATVAVRASEADVTARATRGLPALVSTLAMDFLGDGDGALAGLRASANPGVGPRWLPPLVQLAAAVVLFRRGDWDDALAEADAGLLAAEEADLRLGVFWPYAIGALVASARGQQELAHEWLDNSRVLSAEGVLGRDWLAYAHAIVGEADGETEEAAALLAFTAGRIIDAGAPAFLLNIGADTVRLALATGQRDVADRVSGQLRGVATRTASPIAAAVAGWAGGLQAGDHAAVEVAAQRLVDCRRAPDAARAHHDAAVLAARNRQPGEARRMAKEAFAGYDSLGADRLHARLARRPAGRRPGHAAPPGPGVCHARLGQPDRVGADNRVAGRRGPDQHRDRPAAVHLPAHRGVAPGPGVRQARPGYPGAARLRRRTARRRGRRLSRPASRQPPGRRRGCRPVYRRRAPRRRPW